MKGKLTGSKEQDSTAGPNFASMLILSCAESCWGVPSPNPARRRKLRIVRFHLTVKLTRSAAPPFPTKSYDFAGNPNKNYANVPN